MDARNAFHAAARWDGVLSVVARYVLVDSRRPLLMAALLLTVRMNMRRGGRPFNA